MLFSCCHKWNNVLYTFHILAFIWNSILLSISNSTEITSDVFHVIFQLDNNLTWGLSQLHSSLAVSYNNILGIKPDVPYCFYIHVKMMQIVLFHEHIKEWAIYNVQCYDIFRQLKRLFLVTIFPMYQRYFLDKRHNKQIALSI